MRLQPVGSVRIAPPERFKAYCFSTDKAGDVVYVMGPKVGDFYQVSRTDITDAGKMPAAGIVLAKLDATSCIVQTHGVVRGLYTGFTPGRRLLVQPDGRPGHGLIRPVSGVHIAQPIGQALSSEDILLHLETPTIVLSMP